ncbi:Peptide methionine sulfoxide reductase MsrA [Salisediminibacterium beveridgei]|uniref:Peptide methionine sulfoxide reductase MsrA n=1 Tax=Salisediminibacterium beveridgei TaxID=632773 RepID=A0A1D7QWK9_9BACI|nr:Peptide methionine sulfoxide reductase MsrA [Salisediminibacterium beveridgei]
MESENRIIETIIIQSGRFTPAENWHQKYFLRQASRSWNELVDYFGDEAALLRSTIAAKLNALVKGYLTKAEVIHMIKEDDLFSSEREELLALVTRLKW